MARRATVFSRVSVGHITSAQSLVDKDATDTGAILTVGAPGALGINRIVGTASVAVDFGAVAPHDSSTVTVGVTGAEVDDIVIVTPSSEWSGAYYDLGLTGQVTAAGVVTLAARNSTITSINPAEVNMAIAVIGV